MENQNPPPMGIVIIDLVNDDNVDHHNENANINNEVNEQDCQRQIEEAAEAKEDHLHEIEHPCIVQISMQMTEASVSNYMPGITQINCVIDGMSIAKALTEGGDDSNTPCDQCSNFCDPESCFWTISKIDLNVKGQRMGDHHPTWRHANVRHYLYGYFVDDQYDHMQGPADRLMQAGILPLVPICLPHHWPLPSCVEMYIKQIFPNEDNTPYIGFQQRQRHSTSRNCRSCRNA